MEATQLWALFAISNNGSRYYHLGRNVDLINTEHGYSDDLDFSHLYKHLLDDQLATTSHPSLPLFFFIPMPCSFIFQ
jgi:hypothetical protein